jgi:hypothetical protein
VKCSCRGEWERGAQKEHGSAAEQLCVSYLTGRGNEEDVAIQNGSFLFKGVMTRYEDVEERDEVAKSIHL